MHAVWAQPDVFADHIQKLLKLKVDVTVQGSVDSVHLDDSHSSANGSHASSGAHQTLS